MTLHRQHHTLNALAVRLSLHDQLDLQQIVLRSVDNRGPEDTHLNGVGVLADHILERHGVSVSLDEHTGRITFNPEVIDA